MMKRLALILLVAGLAPLAVACGGGGGGGGSSPLPPIDDTPPVVTPARVTDLRVTSGPSFNAITLAFTAPAGAAGGSYQIRYRSGAIDDSNFASSAALPAGITVPAPAAAGAAETVTVDASLLAAVDPGSPLHFALRAVSSTNGTAAVSNDVATTRPWYIPLRFARRDRPDLEPVVVRAGTQAGALDALDAFDVEAPFALPGNFGASITLAGRSESLLHDIRPPFAAASGEQETWTVVLSGAPNQAVALDFPSFVTTTPMYTFKIGGIEAWDVDISGAALEFSLDGAGARTLTLKVSN